MPAQIHTYNGPASAQVKREVAEIAKHTPRPLGSLIDHRGAALHCWRNYRDARAKGAEAWMLASWRKAFYTAFNAWRALKAEIAAYVPPTPVMYATTFQRPTISWQTKLLYENRESLSDAEQRWLARCEVDWTGAPDDVRPVELARAAE